MNKSSIYLVLILLQALITSCTSSIAQNINNGPVIGALTESSARIYIRTNTPGSVTVKVDTDAGFSNPASFSDSVRTLLDTTVIVNINGLQAASLYYYRVWVNGVQDSIEGHFKTAPVVDVAGNYLFTFGSCMNAGNGNMNELFGNMDALQPDFFLHTGDFTYPDQAFSPNFPHVDSTVAKSYRNKYRYPGIFDMLRNTPIDYVYDDHDFAGNNSSRNSRSGYTASQGANGWDTQVFDNPIPAGSRANSINGYLHFFPGYPMVDTSEGLFHSSRYGNVEIIFLDNRSSRSPNNEIFHYDSANTNHPWSIVDVPGHTILGSIQMSWLKNKLATSTAKWKFIVSGTTFNRSLQRIIDFGMNLQRISMNVGAASGTGMTVAGGFIDGWNGFKADQDTLINFVKNNHIANVVLLTGDTHTSAMDDGTNSGLPEFNCSDLNPSLSSIPFYHIVDSVGTIFGMPPVIDSLWNKGAAGVGNNNVNPSFGKVQIFGNDSIRMCAVDKFGTEIYCWTMADGFEAPTGISSQNKASSQNHQLFLYPNPASNIMAVKVSPGYRVTENELLEVKNVVGKTVLSTRVMTNKDIRLVDVSNFTPGVYVLKIGDLQAKFSVVR